MYACVLVYVCLFLLACNYIPPTIACLPILICFLSHSISFSARKNKLSTGLTKISLGPVCLTEGGAPSSKNDDTLFRVPGRPLHRATIQLTLGWSS